MVPNSPGPQNSEIQPTTRPQTSESQPSFFLPLRVTVIRGHNIPHLKTLLGENKRFYATVTYGERKWQSRPVRTVAQRVEWNEDVDAFLVQPQSHMTISLYAKKAMTTDILVGVQEITCEPRHELDIVLVSTGGHARNSGEPAMVLTISMSAIASSSVTVAVNTPSPTAAEMADLNNPVAEGGAMRHIVQSRNEAMQSTADSISTRNDALPIKSGSLVRPIAESQTEMSRTAISRAEEAINVIDTIKTWESAVTAIKWVMDTVAPIASLNPFASLACSVLSTIPVTLLKQIQRDNNIQTLLEVIRDAFDFAEEADILRSIKPESKQATILEKMLECVAECALFIRLYAEDVKVGKRTLKSIFGQVDENIDQYRTSLVGLRDNFLARAALTTEVAVLEAELGAIIRELPYKGGWRYGDEKRCLPGTREDFLDHIVKWVENPKSERGLVLLGQAGTGKSAIAHEVARRFDRKGLGSYFAFVRKEQSKDEVYQLFTTLARDLSYRYPAFKLALGRVLKENPSLCCTRDYRTLFESLLVDPLKNLPLPSPILIVIDALDESGAIMGKNGVHTFLARRLIDLPPNFRILITSRLENGIEPAFANAQSVYTLYMDDSQLAANTEQDIGVYLRSELPEDVFEVYGAKLAKSAEGLFQWAAVACGFIESTDSLGLSNDECVRRLLGQSRGRSGEGLLDNLYEEVLKEYFKSNEAQMVFRSVMGQLLAAMEPFSISSLITLRCHAPTVHVELEDPDSDRVVKILRHLGSLLSNVTSTDQTRPIVPLHTSFRDFLTSRKSEVFYVDLEDAHRQLAHSCLSIMLDKLRFNICELESSYIANSDVSDLPSRITKHIPHALSYACFFWDDHLEHVAFEHNLLAKLRSFFETKFLFWLEVLSIKCGVALASPALSSLKTWLRSDQPKASQAEVENVLAFVNDGTAFVRYFGMAMARSAPHIYISALPFAPSSSLIVKHYVGLFPHTLSLERGQLSRWPPLEMTIRAHDKSVEVVKFSPDGLRIASGSRDHTIRVWDATTGEFVAGPFTGHTDNVNSIAFSPDGLRITSGSGDKTIRVWDATTGEVVAGPFTEHTDWIRSVAFSPDGKRIASASDDCTIRVWDAATGELLVGPFTGHTDWVRSVAFSPDGQRIASASDDRTIRVWDAATGGVRAGPFTGHTDNVTSIAFSPDGQCIASASADCTIRVWDATTGQIIAGPFTGHIDEVNDVAFSPDGKLIASASDDCTIRVWDATTGEVVAGPLIGHADQVFSAAFSPDRQRITSSSFDLTIRVWRVATGEVVAGPFTGHTDWITSVAFSPNGKRIASASFDQTICVWDAATGELVAGPFTGHTKWLGSVIFSPDGQLIASGSADKTIRVWNATTGEVVGIFTGHTNSVNTVAFSSDGRRIVSGSSDPSIRVWDATTGEVVAGPFTGCPGWVRSVAFSPDGQRIASASSDRTIRVWDATTGEKAVSGPFIGHTDQVNSVAFSSDGQCIASGSKDNTICVWNATTGTILAGPFTGHTLEVNLIAFSPDGRRIASASDDRTICVWDAKTGEVVAGPFIGHSDAVFSVAFSPDGQHIASASTDYTIRVWDVPSGARPLPELTKSMDSVAFTLDEQRITASQDRTDHVEKHDLRVGDVENIDLMNKFLIDSNGWMCGEDGELLLWIPQIHRPYFHRSNTVWIAGRNETWLELTNFVHGSNWATVYGPK